MNYDLERIFEKYDERLIEFARELVRIQSYSDCEEALARRIKAEMEELGFDGASIDGTGNVIGRVGQKGQAGQKRQKGRSCDEKSILFDSHMDTVEVNDEPEWAHPPFAAEIVEGRLYGRGSVDMKSALAASVYAAVIARELGWTSGKTVYVTCTVCEEFCDGENLKMLFEEYSLRPDYVVICEPSDNTITLGHKGKAQMAVKTHGVSAHGSAPEKGINAVYEMAEIIERVKALNERLSSAPSPHGTIVLSDISCVSASLNAVPSECRIYLDRRMVLGETEADIAREMEALTEGKKASWEIGTLRRKSWTGRELVYNPMHTAWRIADDHELTAALNSAYEDVYGRKPEKYDFWDFGTNAVTPVGMGIPTIGFGPGEYKLAHMVNENCEVDKIKEACRFYSSVIKKIR